MADINFLEAQKIVESAFREHGFGGASVKNAWLKDVNFSGKDYPLTANLQNLRDAIAQSVVDILTNTKANPSLVTSGNILGNTGVTRIDGKVNLNNGLPNQSVARVGDEITVDFTSDPIFMTIYSAILTALYTLDLTNTFKTLIDTQYGGLPTPVQIKIKGKITSGSSNVKMGG